MRDFCCCFCCCCIHLIGWDSLVLRSINPSIHDSGWRRTAKLHALPLLLLLLLQQHHVPMPLLLRLGSTRRRYSSYVRSDLDQAGSGPHGSVVAFVVVAAAADVVVLAVVVLGMVAVRIIVL